MRVSMRITCDVDIGNRLLPSFNMKGKSRAMRAQVSVGRKPGCNASSKDNDVYLMIITKQDKNGTKYRVRLLGYS